MNTLFQSLDKLMTEGTVLSITVQKTGAKMVCSILPKQGVKDSAAKKIVPLTASGTAAELDEGIVAAIAAPLAKATGVLTNISEFEKATESAEKNSKKADADKKKFDQLIKKADQLEKDKKYLNAIACLKQALEFTSNKKAIEDRIKKIEAKANEGSIFGQMDTEEPVQENYLDSETDNTSADDDNDNDGEDE